MYMILDAQNLLQVLDTCLLTCQTREVSLVGIYGSNPIEYAVVIETSR